MWQGLLDWLRPNVAAFKAITEELRGLKEEYRLRAKESEEEIRQLRDQLNGMGDKIEQELERRCQKHMIEMFNQLNRKK